MCTFSKVTGNPLYVSREGFSRTLNFLRLLRLPADQGNTNTFLANSSTGPDKNNPNTEDPARKMAARDGKDQRVVELGGCRGPQFGIGKKNV